MIVGFELPQFYAFNPNTGLPLVGGKVFTYEPDTTTPKTAYQDDQGDVAHQNPIILGQLGNATIFLDGVYDIHVQDANGNLVLTLSDVSAPLQESQVTTLIEAAISASALGYGRLAVTASTTLTTSAAAKIVEIDATGGDVTVTLPAAASMLASPEVSFVRVDSSENEVVITGNGTEVVAGSAAVKLQPKGVMGIRSNGSAWQLVTVDERRFDPREVIPTSTGSPTAYVSGPTEAELGERRRFRAHATNTGPASLSGAPIQKIDGANAKQDLAANELRIGNIVQVVYDGADWVLFGAQLEVLNEADLATNSAEKPPSQASVRSFVENRNPMQFQAPVATDAGSSKLLPGVPAGASRLIVDFNLVDIVGAADPLIRFGGVSGLVANGYTAFSTWVFGSANVGASNSTGFYINRSGASTRLDGFLEFLRTGGNRWSVSGVIGGSGGHSFVTGSLDLGVEALTQVEVSIGADTFDGGEIALGYAL